MGAKLTVLAERQSRIRRIRWAARIVALVTIIFILVLAIGPVADSFAHGNAINFDSQNIALSIIAGFLLVSFILSLWRELIAGILLIVVSLYFGVLIYFSLPIFVTGALFLIAWWFSKETCSVNTTSKSNALSVFPEAGLT
jgi:hypothetical protein